MAAWAMENGGVTITVIVAAVFILMLVCTTVPRRRVWSSRFKGPDLSDVGQQLNIVMGAAFSKRRLLTAAEYRAFRIVEHEVRAARRGHRVFAQTSLGEVLQSPDMDAFRSINSKRVDILIVDHAGWPVLAIEYQGEGHYRGTAAARDAVKKEALRKAGVRYLEVVPTDSDVQIAARVRDQMGLEAPAQRAEAPEIAMETAVEIEPPAVGFGRRCQIGDGPLPTTAR